MPDIRGYVRHKILALDIDGARVTDIVDELTLEFEEQLGRAVSAGKDPEAAWQQMVHEIDWKELAEELQAVLEKGASESSVPAGRLSVFENMWNQLRYASRLLANRPSFTLMAVLTIALGIGANTAIFSVLYGVFWAPADNPYSPRLVVIWQLHGTEDGGGVRGGFRVTPRLYHEWQRQSRTIEAFGATDQRRVTIDDDADYPEHFQIQLYTPGLVTHYGGKIALGRDFLPEEGMPGKSKVAVISNQLWQRRYKADPGVIGKEIRLDGVPHTIVGVVQPGWWDRRREPLWTSLVIPQEESSMDQHFLTVIALRKPGVTIEQTQAELSAIAERVAEMHPASHAGWTVRVDPSRNSWLNERTRANLWLLMATVSLLLLIACANVANLLLARGASRQREMAVRISLGATEGQVFRQLLTENLMLSLLGGIAGVGLGWALLKVFLSLLPPFAVPSPIRIEMNGTVLLFTLVTVLIAGVLFGCAPAWQVARSSIHEVLKLGGRSGISGHRHRLGRGLVVAEFALALTLLAVAGLVMRSYWSRTHMDMGVNIEKVLTFQLPLRQDSLTSQESLDQQIRVLMEKIGAVPGVLNTSVVSGVPLTSPRFTRGAPVTPSNKPPADPSRPPQVRFRMVSPGFFQTFDVQTIQGRVLSDQDRRGSMPVAMVNETFARAEFGSQGAVGQEITFWESKRPRKAQVVGVYHDIQNSEEFGDATQPEVIVPITQSQLPNTWFAVRTTGHPTQVRQSIAAAIRSLNPELPMAYVRTMEQVLEERTAFERFETILYGSFAGIALLLAAVGIYGLMTFIVAQRVPEMGLRMALGADRPTLLRSVLNDGLKLALMGLLLGAGGAYYAAEVLESSLHGVGGVDVTAFATVAVVLLLAAMLACFLPASRAAGVDPMKSLRSE